MGQYQIVNRPVNARSACCARKHSDCTESLFETLKHTFAHVRIIFRENWFLRTIKTSSTVHNSTPLNYSAIDFN